jgi:VanZ family protein
MGVYGILAALCYISLIHLEKFSFLARNALVMTIIICSLYGVTDEFHQYFIPNRDCEFWDWLADFAGIIIMLLLIKYYLSKKYDLFKSNEIPSF